MMRLFHSTTRQSADRILDEGFRLEPGVRRSDPGDFGRGCYLTGIRGRAAGWSPVLLSAEVELQNPLVFESSKAAYRWLDEMAVSIGWHTVKGSRWTRERASVELRDHVLEGGHDGIVIHHERAGERYEVVVFDPDTIREIREESER